MTPEQFQQIRRIFELVAGAEPDERPEILRNATLDAPEVAAEVELLVSAYDRRTGFLDRPVTSLNVLDALNEAQSVPDHKCIDRYHLLDRIGEGGMGEVWRAEQRSPVHRIVAVKLVKAGMNTREVVARFASERQALALMDHPAIAKVFDAGYTSEGRPYFAMEFVAGIPITEYCDKHRLSVRARLNLFIRVCEGIQHAHQKAVIHRDVKPSNILVIEVDGMPVPKIIDFGVARAISRRLVPDTFLTRDGALLGTPDYMSPEQFYSVGDDIDKRTDVYSLGVVLYQLLVGALPFDFAGLAYPHILRKLRRTDALRPSIRIRDLSDLSPQASCRRTEPALLQRELRGDLDAITLKALEKDRARRYDSPADLAADIRRHLRSEPVVARPPSAAYQIRKYVLRNRIPVAAAAALVVLLASFGVAQYFQIRRITRERDRADRVTDFMTRMFAVSNPSESHGNKVTAREILDRASRDIEEGLSKDPELQAQMMEVMATVYLNLGLYPQAVSLSDRSLLIRRRTLGPGDPKTADSMSALARALDAAGKRADAERLDREALAVRTRVYGPESPQTLQSLNYLAVHLFERGRYSEAEEMHRSVFEARRRILGPEHPDTLTSMDSLGDTLDAEGRYRDAEALERQALAIKRRILGTDHPETLRALHHLANTLYDEGRDAETERLDRELLAMRERVQGPEHRDTLNAGLALANTLDDEGKVADAERMDRAAIEVQRRVLGPSHPDTLLAMNNLAEVLGDAGKYEEAEQLHRSVLDHRREILGPEHAYTLYSLSKLAWVLILRRKLEEAESLSRTAQAAQFHTLGPWHPDLAETTYNLACIAALRGREDEAIRLLRNALDQGLKPRAVARMEKDLRPTPLGRNARILAIVSGATRRAAEATSPLP